MSNQRDAEADLLLCDQLPTYDSIVKVYEALPHWIRRARASEADNADLLMMAEKLQACAKILARRAEKTPVGQMHERCKQLADRIVNILDEMEVDECQQHEEDAKEIEQIREELGGGLSQRDCKNALIEWVRRLLVSTITGS